MRPDHVIANRNAASYIAEYAAPVIAVPELSSFKSDIQCNLKNKIVAKMQDIQSEYEQLQDLYHFNAFVDSFTYAFVPVPGHTYYLYDNAGHRFMSMIAPQDFTVKYQHLGTCRYNGSGYFESVS